MPVDLAPLALPARVSVLPFVVMPFVVVFDTPEFEVTAPMVNALTRLVGPDDLIGVMVPGMSARDITFARRTTASENLLAREWWGTRDAILPSADPVENAYASCYPGIPTSARGLATDQGIAQSMILRRREQRTLDAPIERHELLEWTVWRTQ